MAESKLQLIEVLRVRTSHHSASLMFQLPWWLRGLKCLPAMQETWVRSLGQEDPLEKEMATHSSIHGLSCGSDSKESICNAGDLGSVPG